MFMGKASYHETLYYLRERAQRHSCFDDNFFSNPISKRFIPSLRKEIKKTRFGQFARTMGQYFDNVCRHL